MWQQNSLNRCTNPPKRSQSRGTRFSRCAAEQQRAETCLRLFSLAQHGHLEASRAMGIRVESRKSLASKATSRREPPAWCRAPAVHEECTSTVSARWVLRARRSRAGIHRIGARSGPAAHQHAWSRPTPRPPAGSPRSTPCTNATPTTAAVVVVVDGRARARSRLYSAAHRVPSATATRQAVALRARAAGAPAAATYKPTRRLRAIWVQLAARAERAGHRCRSRAVGGSHMGR